MDARALFASLHVQCLNWHPNALT